MAMVPDEVSGKKLQETSRFKQIVVVRNPVSTHAGKAERRIAELRQALPGVPITVIETGSEGREANRQAIMRHAHLLGPGSLLCVAAGDGTVSMVIDALLSGAALPDYVRQTPLLPLWCGNANDLAFMLNGPAYRANVARILQRGRAHAVHPLRCRLVYRDGTDHQVFAACYASFGASAFAAEELGRVISRSNPARLASLSPVRFAYELAIVTAVLLRTPPFMADIAGQEKPIFEYIFFNGSRFAKVNGVKRKLTDRNFHYALVSPKSARRIATTIATLSNRRASRALQATHASFIVRSDTLAQFDGETVPLPAGTKVEMSIAAQPFYALATTM